MELGGEQYWDGLRSWKRGHGSGYNLNTLYVCMKLLKNK